jgi:hypothetical protein
MVFVHLRLRHSVGLKLVGAGIGRQSLVNNSDYAWKMEHRGVQYQVVETAAPRGWEWTVQLAEGRTKTGVSCSRGHAVFYAMYAIDLALSEVTEAK